MVSWYNKSSSYSKRVGVGRVKQNVSLDKTAAGIVVIRAILSLFSRPVCQGRDLTQLRVESVAVWPCAHVQPTQKGSPRPSSHACTGNLSDHSMTCTKFVKSGWWMRVNTILLVPGKSKCQEATQEITLLQSSTHCLISSWCYLCI